MSSLTDAVRYELVRLRTLRSTWWLSALAIVLTVALATLVSLAIRSSTTINENGEVTPQLLLQDELVFILTAGAGTIPIPFAAVFMAMIGIFAFGHEYRHGTVRSTLATLPRRDAVVAAKVLTMIAWAVAVSVICLLLTNGITRLVLGSRVSDAGLPTGTWLRTSLGFVVLVVLWAVLGLALAGLFRSVPAAIVTVLVIPLVVEPIIFVVLTNVSALERFEDLVRFLPFNAGKQMLNVTVPGTPPDPLIPSPLAGGLTLAAVTAALVAATWVLFRARDA